MLICPNKNLKEWKDLAASVGENRAMLMWYESEGKVGFTLSAQTTILDNLSKVNSWFKQMKDTDTFWNKLQKDLQIPKDQISLLKESNGKTIEEKLISFVTDYSYTVEINTAKESELKEENYGGGTEFEHRVLVDDYKKKGYSLEQIFKELTEYAPLKKKNTYEYSKEFITKLYNTEYKQIASTTYSNLTVPGGTNYTENEIATPLITPSIKGHASFSTDSGIGWFRSDESQQYQKYDVLLPIGTSGSGKSTFIKSLSQENLVVIEPDAMRIEFTGDMNDKSKDKEIYIEAAKRAVNAIKQGKQVVFDTTNLTKDKRLPFIEAIKKVLPNANIQYKLMELNPELAKQRIKAQLARGENRAAVSDETIDRHAESYKQMLEDIKSEPITPFVDKNNSKTRRILEVQSDWGQKQRKSDEPDINIKYDIQQIINDLQKSGDLKIDCN